MANCKHCNTQVRGIGAPKFDDIGSFCNVVCLRKWAWQNTLHHPLTGKLKTSVDESLSGQDSVFVVEPCQNDALAGTEDTLHVVRIGLLGGVTKEVIPYAELTSVTFGRPTLGICALSFESSTKKLTVQIWKDSLEKGFSRVLDQINSRRGSVLDAVPESAPAPLPAQAMTPGLRIVVSCSLASLVAGLVWIGGLFASFSDGQSLLAALVSGLITFALAFMGNPPAEMSADEKRAATQANLQGAASATIGAFLLLAMACGAGYLWWWYVPSSGPAHPSAPASIDYDQVAMSVLSEDGYDQNARQKMKDELAGSIAVGCQSYACSPSQFVDGARRLKSAMGPGTTLTFACNMLYTGQAKSLEEAVQLQTKLLGKRR